MEGVSGGPIAHQLRIDPRAPRKCMLKLLQYHHACALAQYKTAPVFVKGNGRPSRVCLFCQSRQRLEACHAGGADTALRTACQHDIRVIVLDSPERVADAVGSGRAGCHHIGAFSAQSQLDGDIACCHIGNHFRHHQGRYPLYIPLQDFCVLALHCLQGADA